MTIYKIKTDAGVMYVSADLVQAAAPISTYFGGDPNYDSDGANTDEDGGRWSPTPFQTADARHNDVRMAKLIAEYCEMGEVLAIEEID